MTNETNKLEYQEMISRVLYVV